MSRDMSSENKFTSFKKYGGLQERGYNSSAKRKQVAPQKKKGGQRSDKFEKMKNSSSGKTYHFQENSKQNIKKTRGMGSIVRYVLRTVACVG